MSMVRYGGGPLGMASAAVLLPVRGLVSSQKACDPVRALPLFFVAVARKPPASQLKANHVGRGTSAAAEAVEFADRSFQ